MTDSPASILPLKIRLSATLVGTIQTIHLRP